MKKDVFSKLMAFLADLEKGKIYYNLAHQRDNAILVDIVVPGERWEVEFFDDGSVEVERFISAGEIADEAALSELLAKYSDQEQKPLELPQKMRMPVVAEYETV